MVRQNNMHGVKPGSGRRSGRLALSALCFLLVFGPVGTPPLYGQSMKRSRGESFCTVLSSNTEGQGNVWLTVTGIGHVWDDVPIRSDSSGAKVPGFWISNARAFPEVRVQAGLYEFCMVTLETRPITWGAKIPGFVSGDVKLTWPNNKNLRLFGFGLDLKYQYNIINSHPTLGGYTGFMPEGYVARGSVFESRFLFDADIISKITTLPLRGIANLGIRLPTGEYSGNYQFLFDLGAVYTGYDYDFFTTYSLEAFNNIAGPREFVNYDNKRFLVWFSENPMYVTLGGNVRYANGTRLSIAVPLLLSANEGSKMNDHDRQALHHYSPENYALFPYEMSHGIKDPFDPWYIKWKIAGSLSFPLKFKMTSAEMMRNFLLLKNTRQQNRLDIDNRLRNLERAPVPADTTDDTEKRLREIQKRKEEMQKQE